MSKYGPALRAKIDGVQYLEAHLDVVEFFKQAGVFPYCEKLTNFHQQVAESLAIAYDGRFDKIGKEEFIIDETSIEKFTGLPRTRDCWFKSTVPSNIEFRSYLLPIHKDLIWKKNISMSFLEPQWQSLLKAIFVSITYEGRYNIVMFYHFKLLNHFIGREPINLPFFFHKTLTKMARHVKVKPTKGLLLFLSRKLCRGNRLIGVSFFFGMNSKQRNHQKLKLKRLVAERQLPLKAVRGKEELFHLCLFIQKEKIKEKVGF